MDENRLDENRFDRNRLDQNELDEKRVYRILWKINVSQFMMEGHLQAVAELYLLVQFAALEGEGEFVGPAEYLVIKN